jgi:hypothetical protein
MPILRAAPWFVEVVLMVRAPEKQLGMLRGYGRRCLGRNVEPQTFL